MRDANEMQHPHSLAAPEPDLFTHTPGPWHVTLQDTGEDGIHIWVDQSNPKENVIADINWRGETADGEPGEEDLANASLIAAAPDLLAACEGVLARIGATGDYVGQDGQFAKEIRAAIAKAKGAGQ